MALILGLGKSPGEENGNPLQYSCLGNSMARGAWWVTVHRVTESQTQLSNLACTCLLLKHANYDYSLVCQLVLIFGSLRVCL